MFIEHITVRGLILVRLVIELRLFIERKVVPMRFWSIQYYVERINEFKNIFLITLTYTHSGSIDNAIHPTMLGVCDDTWKSFHEILISSRRGIVSNIAVLVCPNRVAILPSDRVVATGSHLTKGNRIGLRLVQDMGELMMHGMEILLIKNIHISAIVLDSIAIWLHFINVVKRNLYTAWCSTQYLSSRGRTIARRTNEMEYAGAIPLHKVFASKLGIYIIEQISYEMRQQLRTIIVGRRQLEVKVGSRHIETILYLDIVGNHKVIVEPLVELVCCLSRINSRNIRIEDRLREVFLTTARGERSNYSCNTYYI